ncbi:TonB-dependent receptor domain-containing protein [Gimibacter soli]|uniref:TonB-dependent receptor n=1 Tax=Gimibacter soli TaxID=3024400 RepID=A0AAF0BLK7_9PROT|nr:TonB-dependent receptor [Gimibacter soli]WCL54272.1 TonB-dependent receptor [Gimibacter soli]
MTNRTRTMRLVLLAGVAASAAPAFAADAGGAADMTEISVVATRNPMPAFTVPGSVSVVNKAEIDDMVASSISDIFATVPGLMFDGGPRRNGETPAIRGQAGEGVVVLFDGVRQNFLSGHDGRFFIEPDLLKSAEVVRGGGSALYGSGAVGGVLAFRTVDAADLLKEGETAGYRLATGYQDGSDEWMGSATLFGRSSDGKFDGVASLTKRGSGDIKLGDGTTLPSDDDIGSGLLKGTVKVSEALTASFGWVGYRNDAIEPNNGLGNNTGDLVDKKVRSDTYRANLHLAPVDSQYVDASLVAYVNKARVDEAELDSDREIGRSVTTNGVALDNRSRFKLGEGASITFTYGGEYYEDKQTGTDNTTVDGTRGGVPDAKAKTLGLFMQAEIATSTAIGDFLIIPAVRYDHFKNEAIGSGERPTDKATSPKIGVTWEPVEGFMLYGQYGEAFRAPSFNEIFADDLHFEIPLMPGVVAPNYFVPNPDLAPERSKGWEFGAGVDQANLMTTGDRLTLKGGWFRSDVKDLIDLEVNFAFSPGCFIPGMPGGCNAGTSRNINTSEARLDGIELEGSYDHPRFRIVAAYSTIDGKDLETGDYVGILAPNRLLMTGELKLPEIDARIGTRFDIAGKFDKVADPADARAAYESVDIFFNWAPKGALEGLRIDLRIDNLFDTEVERVFAGVVDPGRNAKVRVSWSGSF